jgi:two-component system, OmpR family, sensor histidine kinase MprB
VSLRTRLTLFCSAGIALVLVAGSGATYAIERARLRANIDHSLAKVSDQVFVYGSSRQVTQGKRLTRTIIGGGLPPARSGKGVEVQVYPPKPDFGTAPSFVEVIDVTGKPFLPTPGDVRLPVPEQAIQIARTGKGSYYTDIHLHGTHLRLSVQPTKPKGHALLVARSLGEVDGALGRLAWSLGITDAIGVLLAALVGVLVTRGALSPVRRMSQTARTVAETRNLGERIPVDGRDELSRLAVTFNAMLDSLDTAMRSQRQLVSDASHELRTPLTSLRTNIDVLRDYSALGAEDREKLLRDLTREAEELSALVASLVDLARGSQRELHLREVELDSLVDDVVGRAGTRFPQLEFAHRSDPCTVLGDPQELDRAVWNLVENAAKWSEPGGLVEVTSGGGQVLVRDHGPGIDPGDRPFVFDRFYRSQAARGRQGSGLGLAIVRQVAESHGGKVEVDEAPGGGAAFRLSLLEAAPNGNGLGTRCGVAK